MSFLERTFFGNTVQAWLVAAGVTAASLGVLWLTKRFVLWRVSALAERTTNQWDDVLLDALQQTRTVFLLIVALYVGSLALVLPSNVALLLERVAVIALVIQGGLWSATAITSWVQGYRDRVLEEDPSSATTMSAVSFVGRLVLWVVVLLLILDNLGIDITALITGLGIGGIAVALALQNVLGDLFASLSIVLDKPFVIGDFLIMDDYMGRVEHIGLKTTRLRSLSGEQLIFSNGQLLNARIRNYGRMYERRVVFTIGVTYDTPADQLERIPGLIRTMIEAKERTRFDRSHFKGYGDSALQIETVYYVLDPDYNVYMDIQQELNLEIYRTFEEEGIEFAFPTRTVFWRAGDGSAVPEPAASAS